MKDLTASLAPYAIIIGVIVLICAILGAWLWPYTINTWLIYAGREPCVMAWHGALLGFCPFIGQATVPAAIITWVLMCILGG